MNKRCPSCKHKLYLDSHLLGGNEQLTFGCNNRNCTILKEKSVHYCFISTNSKGKIVGWGASILYKKKVYYLRSFHHEFYQVNPHVHNLSLREKDVFNHLSISDAEDKTLLKISNSFLPYPEKNISKNLEHLLSRLLKMMAYQ
jgi:hypothetical protein